MLVEYISCPQRKCLIPQLYQYNSSRSMGGARGPWVGGGGRGAPPPPPHLFLVQTEARRAEKKFL